MILRRAGFSGRMQAAVAFFQGLSAIKPVLKRELP
jgi:hypothetical protein